MKNALIFGLCLFSSTTGFADLNLEFVNVQLNGQSAKVVLRATPVPPPDFVEDVLLGAYGLNLLFDEFQGVTNFQVDIKNLLPDMTEGGVALGADLLPATISEGSVINYVAFEFGLGSIVEAVGTDLIEIEFSFAEDFGQGKSFDVTLIDVHPDDPFKETLVGLVPNILGSVKIINPFPCDLNLDGSCDGSDIDLLSDIVRSGDQDLDFDLNGDNAVNAADRRFWIVDLMNTYVGDSDLDGVFGTRDLIAIFTAGQYEDDVVGNSTWATGDWNGDREFGTADLIAAFTQAGFEVGPREAVSAVPEPGSCSAFLLGMLFVVGRKGFNAKTRSRKEEREYAAVGPRYVGQRASLAVCQQP